MRISMHGKMVPGYIEMVWNISPRPIFSPMTSFIGYSDTHVFVSGINPRNQRSVLIQLWNQFLLSFASGWSQASFIDSIKYWSYRLKATSKHNKSWNVPLTLNVDCTPRVAIENSNISYIVLGVWKYLIYCSRYDYICVNIVRWISKYIRR